MKLLHVLKALFRWPPGNFLKTLLAVLGIAVVGLAGWRAVVWFTPEAHPSCGPPGVARYGEADECVGVTDGSYTFAPYLKDVTGRIHTANASVVKDAARHPYATVALMIPMIADSGTDQQQILEEVQGAYAAQWRANHSDNTATPPIRLVLANPGRGYAEGEKVSDQLARMARSGKDSLRAVAGFNLSQDATKRTIRRLTRTYGIPVVEGPVTADDLSNTAADPNRFPNLVRVAPDNKDQATALARYRKADPGEAMIVEDSRTDDPYINTLKRAFEDLAPHARTEPYRSPEDEAAPGNLSNTFGQKLANICVARANVIYFAGRPVQLRQFVNALGARGCPKDYTVISGSNASLLAEDRDLDWNALKSGITVEYAALAHPEAWENRKSPPTTGGSPTDYAAFTDALRDSGLPDVRLADSRTIIAHDSVWTAIREIRNVTLGNDVTVPSLREVGAARDNMHGLTPVKGASGWICLDNNGNAYDKAVAVVRLDPADKKARFAGLAWPVGHPPPADCTAPQ
ncbi:hypothetical protein [Streptomyces tremellae]|uniref:ABC transporter substrate-binding protein n=1 Tax=Streptomyces tremellae TaxID=1124239 RepID=A0ABP7FCF5_9ACTN